MPNTQQPTASAEYVTVTIGKQLFGLPIARVQDVASHPASIASMTRSWWCSMSTGCSI